MVTCSSSQARSSSGTSTATFAARSRSTWLTAEGYRNRPSDGLGWPKSRVVRIPYPSRRAAHA
jgi:hypothetical protein